MTLIIPELIPEPYNADVLKLYSSMCLIEDIRDIIDNCYVNRIDYLSEAMAAVIYPAFVPTGVNLKYRALWSIDNLALTLMGNYTTTPTSVNLSGTVWDLDEVNEEYSSISISKFTMVESIILTRNRLCVETDAETLCRRGALLLGGIKIHKLIIKGSGSMLLADTSVIKLEVEELEINDSVNLTNLQIRIIAEAVTCKSMKLITNRISTFSELLNSYSKTLKRLSLYTNNIDGLFIVRLPNLESLTLNIYSSYHKVAEQIRDLAPNIKSLTISSNSNYRVKLSTLHFKSLERLYLSGYYDINIDTSIKRLCIRDPYYCSKLSIHVSPYEIHYFGNSSLLSVITRNVTI